MAVPGNGTRYTVHCAATIARAIRRAHHRASRQGRGPDVTNALRQIIERLEINPNDTGEPAYRLPSLRLHVRTVVIRPLAVDFAVADDRLDVFIKGVKLLSPSGK